MKLEMQTFTNKVKLTPRAWALYNLLKSDPDKWFDQKEICDSVRGYEYIERNNDRCPSIREDKILINESLEVDKLIVMKNYCFKIATVDEYREERAKHIRRLRNQALEIRNMDLKVSRDQQMKLLSNQGRVIDEDSKARSYIETFINFEGEQ